MKVAVLASGSGSTFEALVHAYKAGITEARPSLVISNNSDAGVFKRVARMNDQYGLKIQAAHISGATHPGGAGARGEQTLEEANAILERISGFELGLYLGYMKKAHPILVNQGPLQINTHPGPLPETKGLHGIHVQEAVIEMGLGYSAQTLHIVNEEYDNGTILASHRVHVLETDTPESLFESVQLVEKTWLPVDLQQVIQSGLI